MYQTNTGTQTSKLHRAREEVTRYGGALANGIAQLVRLGGMGLRKLGMERVIPFSTRARTTQ